MVALAEVAEVVLSATNDGRSSPVLASSWGF